MRYNALIIILFSSLFIYGQEEFVNDPYCGSDDALHIKSIKYPWYKQSAPKGETYRN